MFKTTQEVLILDVPNLNNRVYPEDVIKRAIEQWQDETMIGQIGMPAGPTMVVDYDNVSHQITNLRIENGSLIADITVLDTPNGRLLQDLLTTGACMDFRTAGIGHVVIDDNGVGVVQPGFEICSINAVADGA